MRARSLPITRGVVALALACLVAAGCGGGGGGGASDSVTVTAPAGGGPAQLTVEAHDVYLVPKRVTAPAGELQIHYVEHGSQQHTLVIDGVKGFKLEVDPKTNSDTGTVDLQPGVYTYYCTVPGHRTQGMQGTITVAS
jgi:plastocyanin